EVLYPAMEDYQLDIMIGEGPAARSIRLSLPPFTLVGATTRAGLLTSPLRDRFSIVQRLEFYGVADLERIVKRSAAILGVAIDEGGARRIAQRSRGTPRITNRLLRRVRDYAWLRARGHSPLQPARARGIVCAVVSLAVEYRAPARLDDELQITCEPSSDGAASLRFAQRIYRAPGAGRAPQLLLEASLRVACV